MENLVEMRDVFRKCADTIDEMIVLEERKKAGEDVAERLEETAGRLIIQMLKLQALNN